MDSSYIEVTKGLFCLQPGVDYGSSSSSYGQVRGLLLEYDIKHVSKRDGAKISSWENTILWYLLHRGWRVIFLATGILEQACLFQSLSGSSCLIGLAQTYKIKIFPFVFSYSLFQPFQIKERCVHFVNYKTPKCFYIGSCFSTPSCS